MTIALPSDPRHLGSSEFQQMLGQHLPDEIEWFHRGGLEHYAYDGLTGSPVMAGARGRGCVKPAIVGCLMMIVC